MVLGHFQWGGVTSYDIYTHQACMIVWLVNDVDMIMTDLRRQYRKIARYVWPKTLVSCHDALLTPFPSLPRHLDHNLNITSLFKHHATSDS